MPPPGTSSKAKNQIFFLTALCGMQGSQFPDQRLNSCPPAVKAWSLNHWTTNLAGGRVRTKNIFFWLIMQLFPTCPTASLGVAFILKKMFCSGI